MAEAELPFDLGTDIGEPISLSSSAGSYQIVIEGQDVYNSEFGASVEMRLRVVDAAGQPVLLELDDATSTLIGPDYTQELPPTQQEGEWLNFSMRIPYRAKVVTALLFAVAALWVTELIPLAATAFLVPIVVVLAGVTDARTALQPFASPIIVLFLAGFLMAEGMRRTGVDRLIALSILRRSSLKPAYLMLTLMVLAAFLSMWMSNTASVAILIPIALAVFARIPEEQRRPGFRRALILGVAYAATVGGIGSAIGTPANMMALTYLNQLSGSELTFSDWFAYGLPMVLVMLPLVWLYLVLANRLSLRPSDANFSREIYDQEVKANGGLTSDQRMILAVFAVVVGLWLTEAWHHIPTVIVALGGAFVLFFIGIIKGKDLQQINWNALLTFGGGLAIGSILVSTGVSDWVALQLTALGDLPPQLVILLVAAATLVIGGVISNTAAAAMLIPLTIPLAYILRIDPRLLVAVVAIGTSIDFALVVGTPPTMMAYSTGFFTSREIFKRGIVLDLIGVLVLGFGVVWLWQLLGVVSPP